MKTPKKKELVSWNNIYWGTFAFASTFLLIQAYEIWRNHQFLHH